MAKGSNHETGSRLFLPLFTLIQSRRANPLVPLWLFKDRNRAGSYLSMLLIAFGPMGAFYLLTLYMQPIMEYSPIRTGLAWLPFGIGIVLGAGVTTKIVPYFPPRVVAALGMVIAAGALLWLSGISRETAYASHIMPAIFALAFGFAMGFVPLTLTAVKGVRAQETGNASALLNASQQIGVAFGLAVLSSISVTVTARSLPDALASLYEARSAADAEAVRQASDAIIAGYSAGLTFGAVFINAAKGQAPVAGEAVTR